MYDGRCTVYVSSVVKMNSNYEVFFRSTANDQRPTFFAAEKGERRGFRRGGVFKKFNMFKVLTCILPLALSVEHSAFERLRAPCVFLRAFVV